VTGPSRLPLTQTDLHPAPDACKARPQFPGARNAQAALAGALLRAGCWEESHTVAQDISSAEGSYWHGIIHRMEPDASNAGYWFRQVGKHPIFPELHRRAQEILAAGGPQHWRLKNTWDPFLFIEWCEEARKAGGAAEAAALEIQMAEWQLLFDWCSKKSQSD
jgi:hypothetical protein